MSRTTLCTFVLILTVGVAANAGGNEPLLTKLCENDVPDCICRWCCPDYCRKPLPCVCGPLPPQLTCGPKCYTHFWCQRHPTSVQHRCPLGNCTADTMEPRQPDSISYVLGHDASTSQVDNRGPDVPWPAAKIPDGSVAQATAGGDSPP